MFLLDSPHPQLFRSTLLPGPLRDPHEIESDPGDVGGRFAQSVTDPPPQAEIFLLGMIDQETQLPDLGDVLHVPDRTQ